MNENIKFGRIEGFDERSRAFSISGLIEKPLRSYTWRCLSHLDQRATSECTAFSFSHDLIARPIEIQNVTENTAHEAFKQIKLTDGLPSRVEGSTVLAAAKVFKNKGYFEEYRWAFSLEEALLAIGYNGGGILGTNWYDHMMHPDKNGFVVPVGRVLGGHAIFVNKINLKEKYVGLVNSWGPTYGINGTIKLSFANFERLLHEQGEFCIPINRKFPIV